MNTLAPSFLIGSSSYLQVKRTTIISQTSYNLGQIRPRTAELANAQDKAAYCVHTQSSGPKNAINFIPKHTKTQKKFLLRKPDFFRSVTSLYIGA